MMRSTKKSAAGAALLATALLALTGCASGDAATGNGAPDGGQQQTQEGLFEFTVPTLAGVDGELEARIPSGLIEAARGNLDALPITSVKITPRELDSSSKCAIDIEVTYADGGPGPLAEPRTSKSDFAAEYKRGEQEFLDSFGVSTMAEAEQKAAQEGGDAALDLQYYQEAFGSAVYDSSPAWRLIADAKPISELDEASPEFGDYVSDDAKTFTFVQSCAATEFEQDGTSTFYFPGLDKDGKATRIVASIDLSVMQSGTMSIVASDVTGYELDSQGNWIAD